MGIFGVVGLASCLRSLEGLMGKTEEDVWKAVEKNANAVRDDMESMAPVGPTGELSTNIGIETMSRGETWYVLKVGPSDDLQSGIPDMPYSVMVEFGVGRDEARSFIRPAAERNKPFKI